MILGQARGMRRALTAALLAGTLTASGTLVSATARADDYFTPLPDVGKHSWCYASGFNQETPAINSMENVEDQTVVDTKYESACDSATDVKWFEKPTSFFSVGEFGRTECKDRQNALPERCDNWYVYLNMSLINSSTYPTVQRRQTVCHELGHTLGVRHYSHPGSLYGYTTCMVSGEAEVGSGSWYKKYDQHHVTAHINPWFNQP